jgi:transcriptional regulator GlxA family with amidase domain
VGLSTRQLERLFQKYLNCTPSRYYLEMRLSRARSLLQQTCMSVMNVALATGFVSASHFSKSYRLHFGYAPSDEKRSQMRAEPELEASTA